MLSTTTSLVTSKLTFEHFDSRQKKIYGVKDDDFYKGELLIALGVEKWAGRPGWITDQHR